MRALLAIALGLSIACQADKSALDTLLLEALFAQGSWATIYPGAGTFNLALRSTSGTYSRSYYLSDLFRPARNESGIRIPRKARQF